NIGGFLNMLLAAREVGVSRFVYASSSAIYGDHPAQPQVESRIGKPLSPYALSKHVNELYAEIYARCYGYSSIGLRYFNVFGPRQDPKGDYAAVIPKWITAMMRKEPVYINGDGETVRDFCHIDNITQANVLAAAVEDPAAVNQVYNIAFGEETTLNRLFDEIRRVLEPRLAYARGLQATYRERRAGDIKLSQANIGKARELLGYRPQTGLRDGLTLAAEWYASKTAPRHATKGRVGLRSRPRDGSVRPRAGLS
ncbi:MAG TPA: NAD-dependent epimerase/dehydratase family protein, partial [Burkholderiales bacterium]